MSAPISAPLAGGHSARKQKKSVRNALVPYTSLDFKKIDTQAKRLADHIEIHFEELAHILLEYESYEVVVDEVSRTLDLLGHLEENKKYFQLRIGEVATFLPRNQPVYALACFVIVPSFMASAVHFRIPHAMQHFFPKLLALLEIYQRFPNIIVSHAQRAEFLLERTALRVNPKTNENIPVTDAVIFTGAFAHTDQLRFIFDDRTLFIANGAGHNPLIVSKDADVVKAAEAVLKLQLYNQGQDCAAPNAILVHKSIFPLLLHQLRDGLRAVGVGDYRDRQFRVGPISDSKDLVRIQDFLIENRRWLDPTTPGIIRTSTATLEPTIISKPLKEGGNFTEIFAPVIFVQEYEKDSELELYFESPHYAQHAMYVSLYGTSKYVESLIGRSFRGKVLHDKSSVLHNTNPHARGVERGTQPYGGYGHGASSLSINGKITSKPTLPQRDIYKWVAKPILRKKSLQDYRSRVARFIEVKEKNVQKLLRLKVPELSQQGVSNTHGTMYVDMESITKRSLRYAKIEEGHSYRLLKNPNAEYIAELEPNAIKVIRALRGMLLRKPAPSLDDFTTKVFMLPVGQKTSAREKHVRQLRFFRDVYQLILGENSGPRLAQFLLDVDRKKLCELLDV